MGKKVVPPDQSNNMHARQCPISHRQPSKLVRTKIIFAGEGPLISSWGVYQFL